MKNSKKNQRTQGTPDQLTIENVIRKRHNQNWPTVIYQMMGRVQGVNQAWQHIMNAIMMTEGLRVTYAREGEDLVITVAKQDKVEQFPIKAEQIIAAKDHVEVIVMDKLKQSAIIREAYAAQ